MLKVYIGAEDKQVISRKVLRHSFQRRTPETLDFVELKNLSIPLKQKMYTGFSFYRFIVPKVQTEGLAITFDTDIIGLCDIRELADKPNPKGVLARPRGLGGYYTSVMVMDLSMIKWDFDELCSFANKSQADYHRIMWCEDHSPIKRFFSPLESVYNDLDTYSNKTKILHYTKVPTQPWTFRSHPFRNVWLTELKAALDSGYIPKDEILAEEEKGNCYRGLCNDAERCTNPS